MNPPLPPAASAYLWMLFAAFSFSAMATFTHALAERCDWQVVATVRTAVALVIATTLAVRSGARLGAVMRSRTMWIRSFAGTVSLVCTFYALPRMPIADTLTITNIFPIWVALLSWPLLGEVPSWEAWVAIAIGVVGVVLVTQPHLAGDAMLPVAAAIVASVTTSIAMLGLHRLAYLDPRAIVAHFSAVALAACLLLVAFTSHDGSPDLNLDVLTIALLAGVGISATIGQLFLTKAFAAGPPAKVSVVALTQVGFGILFDAMFWQHPLGWPRVLGIALVTAPTAWLLLTQRHPPADDLSVA